MILTKQYGWVEERKPYEPALLGCANCNRNVIHNFAGRREFVPAPYVNGRSTGIMLPAPKDAARKSIMRHDMYSCGACGTTRIWG